MNSSDSIHVMDLRSRLSRVLCVLILASGTISTRDAIGQEWSTRNVAGVSHQEQSQPLTRSQLQDLIGPIALYPDDLIAVILPASTNPLQIVQARRYLDQHDKDPALKPDDKWDDSIVAILNYPEVLQLMDENLDWTVKLGESFIVQEADVMDAIQLFRKRANSAGNLKSDDKQIVLKEGNTIQIQPADPQVVYVPYYEPERVVVHQYVPVYNYYPSAYPLYYYPYAPDYRFSTNFFWGISTAFVFSWNTGISIHTEITIAGTRITDRIITLIVTCIETGGLTAA